MLSFISSQRPNQTRFISKFHSSQFLMVEGKYNQYTNIEIETVYSASHFLLINTRQEVIWCRSVFCFSQNLTFRDAKY